MPNTEKVHTIRALEQRNELHYEVVDTLWWERSRPFAGDATAESSGQSEAGLNDFHGSES